MSPLFHKKTIVIQETLGERFKKVRLGKLWTLKRASKETGIAARYLEALERSFYDELPGEVYAKNFIRAYSKHLGLPPKDMLALYADERHVSEHKKHSRFLKEIEKTRVIDILLKPSTLKLAVVCATSLLVLSYIAWNFYITIARPHLELFTPQDNITINTLRLEVRCKSE